MTRTRLAFNRAQGVIILPLFPTVVVFTWLIWRQDDRSWGRAARRTWRAWLETFWWRT